MTVRHRLSAVHLLSSASRVALLHALQRSERSLGVERLAEAAGLHLNTTREHLERLRAGGFVDRETEARTTRGRPRVLYRVTDRPAAATADDRFREQLLRTVLERDRRPDTAPTGDDRGPGAEGESPAGGAGDGATARQMAALEVHLDDLRLAPERRAGGREIHLHACPFLALARERTEMVCSVHLEIARGVLASQGGPVRADRLRAFVGPRLCVLDLSVAEERARPAEHPVHLRRGPLTSCAR